MQKIGYALVALATGQEVMAVGSLPCRLTVPGVGVADFDQVGQVMPDSLSPTHKLVERWANTAPSPQHTLASESASYDGTKVVVTRTWNAPAAPTQAELQAYLAAKRYAVETGGMVLNGATIATDRESKAAITAAYLLAIQDPKYAVPNWKVAPGIFITLSNAAIRAIGMAVSRHVQACFDLEAQLGTKISQFTVKTYAEIDAAAWPTNK